MLLNLRIAFLSYVFNNNIAKTMSHEYDRILTFNKFFDSSSLKSIKFISLFISRSSRILKSRSCLDTLFLLLI